MNLEAIEEKFRKDGSKKFVSISELQKKGCKGIPDKPGVYFILSKGTMRPGFKEEGTGGWFKGKYPNVPREKLERHWVEGAKILYIGMSRVSLRRRIKAYMDFGRGKPVGHRGGRAIWQLAGSENLLVAWKSTPKEDPREVERRLIEGFKKKYDGKRPFANFRG